MGHHSGAATRLEAGFGKMVAGYIESCHLEDGGYFFARIPPSSGMDTCLAVSDLSILGLKPERPRSVVDFITGEAREGILNGVTGAFIAVAVLSQLGMMTSDVRDYARRKVMAARNKAGSFGTTEDTYIEVYSELEDTYRAVWVLKTIGAVFDEQRVAGFVSGLRNRDGGYGRHGRSTLASTCYATGVYRLLGVAPANLASTRAYLRGREEGWQFIEELYWLVTALANIAERPVAGEEIISFVLGCQRPGGGFSRSPVIGIPTLEYTFYALAILRKIGAI